MTRRRLWLVVAGVTVFLIVLGAVVRNQMKVDQGRRARSELARQRRALFEMLQPVALRNCELERFGERHDGGYLMCRNLLGGVRSGYSYGIAGYDKWGCDVSIRRNVPVHQYDCFNTTRPACPDGDTVFHEECVGDAAETVEGRVFDTISNQIARNGDRSRRIVLKIDVEGAEWDSFLSAADELFEQIDQMAVEFHWLRDRTSDAPDQELRWRRDEEKYIRVVQRLKRFFVVAHIHFNNASCIKGLEPFPTWAYEVLLVNKHLAVVDPSGDAGGLHPLDAPNNPAVPDCQPTAR